MTGIYYLIPTLISIFVSYLVVRAGAIALMMTGLDRNRAVFQALSAFTGTGYTTSESENIVRNYKRRKVISILMVLGNAGIVTVFITATSSMVKSKGVEVPINAVLLLLGILVIYRLATYRGFIQRWESYVERIIIKRSRHGEAELESAMGFIEGHGLVRAIILSDSHYIGMRLGDIIAGDKRMRVLGLERDEQWDMYPDEDREIVAGDMLVVYGPINAVLSRFT